MRPRIACDASALVALLVDAGPDGTWAAETLAGHDLVATALLPFETANVLRRHERAGLLESGEASQAHADLLDIAIELWPYDLVASRAWELRTNLSAYDAGYVAVAELVGAPLATLDRATARAPGARCAFVTP